MGNKKYFIIGYKEGLSKEESQSLRLEKEKSLNDDYLSTVKVREKALLEEDSLRHVEGRVVIKIDIDSKDSWTFENGTKIEYKRRFNTFNQREASPVNAIVISGEGISKGAEILIHPNAVHDTNRIFGYKNSNDNIRYYSIEKDMCFAWHDGESWRPLPPFDFALRIFVPYRGTLSGIEPTQIKDELWVTTGELKGKAVKTLVACDYEIVFQDKNGKEGRLIRFRPFGEPSTKREEEAICILNNVTEKILSGEYLVGVNITDAKPLEISAYAD